VGAIHRTPTGAIEALDDLPPLDLLIQGDMTSAVYRLWSLGGWSYLHLRGHSCMFHRLQKSDPKFNTGIDVMKPVFKLEPKYRVTI